MLDASVVICTRNRCAQLARALESVRQIQAGEALRYEVVVVDNASGDATADVVRAFQADSPVPCRYVWEGEPGISAARNRGVRESRGRIIAFADDDVVVDAGWLSALVGAYGEHGAAAAGGRILPRWPGGEPAWYSERIGGPVAHLDYGPAPRDVSGTDRLLWGANFSVARSWLTRMGGFDARLGRKGRPFPIGEDTELLQRIVAGGGRVIYVPGAVVWHVVGPRRARRTYFRKWYYAFGRTHGRMVRLAGVKVSAGLLARQVRDFIQGLVRYCPAWLCRGRRAAFEEELHMWQAWGGLVELCRPGAGRGLASAAQTVENGRSY